MGKLLSAMWQRDGDNFQAAMILGAMLALCVHMYLLGDQAVGEMYDDDEEGDKAQKVTKAVAILNKKHSCGKKKLAKRRR